MISIDQLSNVGNVQLVINASDLKEALTEFCRGVLANERANEEVASKKIHEAEGKVKKYYTREQAASKFNVSVRTIDGLLNNGFLGPRHKIGGRVLIERKYVDNLPSCQ